MWYFFQQSTKIIITNNILQIAYNLHNYFINTRVAFVSIVPMSGRVETHIHNELK